MSKCEVQLVNLRNKHGFVLFVRSHLKGVRSVFAANVYEEASKFQKYRTGFTLTIFGVEHVLPHILDILGYLGIAKVNKIK